MSGGTFDYQNYIINDFIDTIKKEVFETREDFKLRDKEEYYYDNLQSLTDEEKARFKTECKKVIEELKSMSVKLKAIDYFIAGDTGIDDCLRDLETTK